MGGEIDEVRIDYMESFFVSRDFDVGGEDSAPTG
jgi:hypothetical protein